MKEICKYKLIKIVPKSNIDLHRELEWEAYGAAIEKDVELTKEELDAIANGFNTTLIKDMITLESNVKSATKKLRKILEEK